MGGARKRLFRKGSKEALERKHIVRVRVVFHFRDLGGVCVGEEALCWDDDDSLGDDGLGLATLSVVLGRSFV